jgi:hypothetical protein
MVRETDGTGTPTVRVVVTFSAPGPAASAALGRAAWAVADARSRGWDVRLVTRAPVGPDAQAPPPVAHLPRPRRYGWTADAAYRGRWRTLGTPVQPGPAAGGPFPPAATDRSVAADAAGPRSRPVERPVRSDGDARRRLAAARPGPIDTGVPRDGVPTRWITPEGDWWR